MLTLPSPERSCLPPEAFLTREASGFCHKWWARGGGRSPGAGVPARQPSPLGPPARAWQGPAPGGHPPTPAGGRSQHDCLHAQGRGLPARAPEAVSAGRAHPHFIDEETEAQRSAPRPQWLTADSSPDLADSLLLCFCSRARIRIRCLLVPETCVDPPARNTVPPSSPCLLSAVHTESTCTRDDRRCRCPSHAK